jgi:hypothetical protein
MYTLLYVIFIENVYLAIKIRIEVFPDVPVVPRGYIASTGDDVKKLALLEILNGE